MSDKNKVDRDQDNLEMENEMVEDTAQKNTGETQDVEETNEVDKLKSDLQKEKDSFLRLFAEFENYKKRTSKERIELFSTANRELMTALLPVLDDFERGLKELEKSSDDAYQEGMKLIYNKFKNTLIQKGLKEIEVEKGYAFDSEIHEAITQIPAPSEDLKGKIFDVVEKGYRLGDTIIRFPKVVTCS